MNDYKKLYELIRDADAIVIGAGSGLSTSAGFTYSGKRFHQYFQDFIDAYGFEDMYSGGFYPFPSLNEYWAYWSRYIYINRYMDPSKPVYQDLYELIKDKDYFVITTNVDHCFQKAGFDKHRLFYTQGDYGLFQCQDPCHNKTYDNKEIIEQMFHEQHNRQVDSSLIPHCPVCHKPMTMNLRADDTFVEAEGWYKAARRYDEFIDRHKGMNVLYLELGVGMNTPVIIKFPFWRMVYRNKLAHYVTIGLDHAYAPDEIKKQSLCIHEDIGDVLKKLKGDIQNERINDQRFTNQSSRYDF